MKILISCFDAFGGESINPASLVVNKLPDKIGTAEIIKIELPTVFGKSVKILTQAIDEVCPDAVISIGQAGGRNRISVERVAINIDDARIADNEGASPKDAVIDPKGASAYFSTLPIKDMVNAMMKADIPAQISNSAGTFVCNHVMYGVLNHIAKNNLSTIAGFIHIPYLPQQIIDKPTMPALSLDTLVAGIEAAIRSVAGQH